MRPVSYVIVFVTLLSLVSTSLAQQVLTPVLRKTSDGLKLHESQCKWRKASCAPAQKRLVEGLRLCEAELSCFGPESLGDVTSAPS